MINHSQVSGEGSRWEPVAGPFVVLPTGTEVWARSGDGRARQGLWGRLLGTSLGVISHPKRQHQASPRQHVGQDRGLYHAGSGSSDGEGVECPPAPTTKHVGPRNGSLAGNHVGTPEIWDVDAQAGVGVPSKGCISPLGDFQGTAAPCPCAAMAQGLPHIPPLQ